MVIKKCHVTAVHFTQILSDKSNVKRTMNGVKDTIYRRIETIEPTVAFDMAAAIKNLKTYNNCI
jgi:hypothetical protein